MPLLPPTVVASKFIERLNGKDRTPPFVAVERSGVMLNEKMTSAERATLIGLAQVTLRTEGSARLRYLKGTEVETVLSMGAHGCKEVVDRGEDKLVTLWGHKAVLLLGKISSGQKSYAMK